MSRRDRQRPGAHIPTGAPAAPDAPTAALEREPIGARPGAPPPPEPVAPATVPDAEPEPHPSDGAPALDEEPNGELPPGEAGDTTSSGEPATIPDPADSVDGDEPLDAPADDVPPQAAEGAAQVDNVDRMAEAACDRLVARGTSREAAEASVREKLELLGEEARERLARGDAYADIDAWYREATAAALADLVPAPTPAPCGTAPPPYHLRRRVVENVSAHGYTLDGHRREHWTPGEVGDFKQHVVDSAPSAFAKP